MSFFEIQPPIVGEPHWGEPRIASASHIPSRDEVQAWLNDMLGDPAIRVLAVTPVAATTQSADRYGYVMPVWFATVLYQERLLPNGPEGGEE